MPFTSSRLLLTKETYYYPQANANKGHQETLSSQTLNVGMVEGLIVCRLPANKRNANQTGAFCLVGSSEGALESDRPSRTVLGCPRRASTCTEKLQSLVSWRSLTDPRRAQGLPGREEGVPLSVIYCLLPEATVRRKTTLGGLLKFYMHKTGLYNKVKILHPSNFHRVNTSIKNVSEVTVLISPSGACLCLEVNY